MPVSGFCGRFFWCQGFSCGFAICRFCALRIGVRRIIALRPAISNCLIYFINGGTISILDRLDGDLQRFMIGYLPGRWHRQTRQCCAGFVIDPIPIDIVKCICLLKAAFQNADKSLRWVIHRPFSLMASDSRRLAPFA